MGIDISAKVIYGFKMSEVNDDDVNTIIELINNDEINFSSPSYDSLPRSWTVGVEINNEDINDDSFKEDAKMSLFDILEECGLLKYLKISNIHITPHVY